MSDYTPSLHRLAQLARNRPTLLAGLLAIYQKQEGMDEIGLAKFLGCDVSALLRLALCHRPRMSVLDFRTDVEEIATYTQVNALQLAKLIRSAAAQEERRHVSGNTRQILLAARDHDESNNPSEAPESDDNA
jgi:hypothetical protein